MKVRVFLANCEQQLLREIADPQCKRLDVAKTYALAMEAVWEVEEVVDWARVNNAIVDRWSVSGLTWIKAQAHSGKCWAPKRASLNGGPKP